MPPSRAARARLAPVTLPSGRPRGRPGRGPRDRRNRVSSRCRKSFVVETAGAQTRLVEQFALLRRRVQRKAVEAAAAGLLQVRTQHAVVTVELDEGGAAHLEHAGPDLAHALDLAQLPQQRLDRLQRGGIGLRHLILRISSEPALAALVALHVAKAPAFT